MKKTKIIVPALGLLLLSTAASVTGTVAWFSANTDVDVTGMKVTTQVSGNLLIATANTSDDLYSSSKLEQTSEGILEPVSTVDGNNFFYSKEDVKGDGSITPGTDYTFETYADTDDGKLAFSKYYFGENSATEANENAVGFVDYEFYLKATSTAANDEVFISKCNLLYDGDALGDETAWRVAIFADEVDKNTDSTKVSTSAASLVTIMSLDGAEYFDEGKAISNQNGTKASVTNLNVSTGALIGKIDGAGDTQRFHVIVRLWLEGEDTTCTNETFALLTDEYTLDITCGLKASGATSPATVTNIGSVAPTAA